MELHAFVLKRVKTPLHRLKWKQMQKQSITPYIKDGLSYCEITVNLCKKLATRCMVSVQLATTWQVVVLG